MTVRRKLRKNYYSNTVIKYILHTYKGNGIQPWNNKKLTYRGDGIQSFQYIQREWNIATRIQEKRTIFLFFFYFKFEALRM